MAATPFTARSPAANGARRRSSLQVHTARGRLRPQQAAQCFSLTRPWPVDELLLTRLLAPASPEALAAYQAPAELTATTQRGLRLSVAEFRFGVPVLEAYRW